MILVCRRTLQLHSVHSSRRQAERGNSRAIKITIISRYFISDWPQSLDRIRRVARPLSSCSSCACFYCVDCPLRSLVCNQQRAQWTYLFTIWMSTFQSNKLITVVHTHRQKLELFFRKKEENVL